MGLTMPKIWNASNDWKKWLHPFMRISKNVELVNCVNEKCSFEKSSRNKYTGMVAVKPMREQ